MTYTALHVWRVPARALPSALWQLATGPGRLRREPTVRFVKLLGTGKGSDFGAGKADLTRWAAITVTDDPPPRFPQWSRIATAACRIDLRPLASRGSWAGAEPFPVPAADSPADPDDPAGPSGARPEAGPSRAQPETGPSRTQPVRERWTGETLAITRARLRPGRALTFWRAIGEVAAPLASTPGLLASFGIGEAPVGWQGTVSLWRTQADLVAFAYRQPEHRRAIERSPIVGWYAEELFARFAVLDVTGDARVLGRFSRGVGQPDLDGQG